MLTATTLAILSRLSWRRFLMLDFDFEPIQNYMTMAPDASAATEGSGSIEKKQPHVVIDGIDGSDTLIILFGWAGCRQRYLSKYSEYYKQAGYSTVCFTAPIAKIRSFDSYMIFAKEFLKAVAPLRTFPHIFYHAFSMNGCSTFTAFWDLISKQEEGRQFRENAKGILFDSSPAFTTPAQVANAISFATLPPSKYSSVCRNTYRGILLTFFSIHRGVLWVRSLVDDSIYEKSFAYCRMLSILDEFPKDQLYLYGPADEVCSEESIEHFATQSEQRGGRVIKVNMKDSLHCQHFRTYPDLYRNSCLEFISNINTRSSNEKSEKIVE